MKYQIKGLSLLAAASLLVGCAGDQKKPAGTVSVKVVRDAVAIQHHHTLRQILPYVPLPEWGDRTVPDVLTALGPYTVSQLRPYFEKAGVAYPPRQLTLIAFKEERKLEVWARDRRQFRFIRAYDIRAASGKGGPKLRQGDKQVPEGIYRIVRLNPNSNYHLSMKLNYPNEFDLFHANMEGRDEPGDDIFIHGDSVSAGCLAMGDQAIEELFVLAAHVGEDNIKVVIAPYDPRIRPLQPIAPDLPSWTLELYREISSEIVPLTEPPPVRVTSSRPEARTDRRVR